MYNFDATSSKQIQSQKKQIQEVIPHVLLKQDLLKLKKLKNREIKSGMKESHSRKRIHSLNKSQSIYSGKNVPIVQSELAFQQIALSKSKADPGRLVLFKQLPANPSFVSIQPNIYGKSHHMIQNSNGETFFMPVNHMVRVPNEPKQSSNVNVSHYSKSRMSNEEHSIIKNAMSQHGSMNNFAVFGSSHNLDQSQFQLIDNFQRSSHQSGSLNEPLRKDLLSSKTTSIKGIERSQSHALGNNLTNDFWYPTQQESAPMAKEEQSAETGKNQHFRSSCSYLNDPRQSVNLQELKKPQFLIYSHNPSLKLVENKSKGPGAIPQKKINLNDQLSGKSMKKSAARKRVRKSRNLENYHSMSSQFQKSNQSVFDQQIPQEEYKMKLKTIEKDLKDLNIEDLKFIFEILDDKKQGSIDKNNFKFPNLPLKTMHSLEPFIKEMLVREGSLDFNQFIKLIQNLISKDE